MIQLTGVFCVLLRNKRAGNFWLQYATDSIIRVVAKVTQKLSCPFFSKVQFYTHLRVDEFDSKMQRNIKTWTHVPSNIDPKQSLLSSQSIIKINREIKLMRRDGFFGPIFSTVKKCFNWIVDEDICHLNICKEA